MKCGETNNTMTSGSSPAIWSRICPATSPTACAGNGWVRSPGRFSTRWRVTTPTFGAQHELRVEQIRPEVACMSERFDVGAAHRLHAMGVAHVQAEPVAQDR